MSCPRAPSCRSSGSWTRRRPRTSATASGDRPGARRSSGPVDVAAMADADDEHE
jgi:hypothetical protein